jgi:prevent-host-death family protein
MTIFNIHDAKTHFSKLLERVLRGEEVVIARAGKPVARLTPFTPNDMAPRKPGKDQGQVVIHPDFDAPLLEFDI